MMKMAAALAALVVAGVAAQAQTRSPSGFDKLRCGDDIVRALQGRTMLGGTIVKLQEKYRHLQLEHLGADNIARGLDTISWRICGKEYMTLQSGDRLRDIIEFPAHDRTTPAFGGICVLNGAESQSSYVGVLAANGKAGDVLPVKAAWVIDEKSFKFRTVAAETLKCSTDTVITVDMPKGEVAP